MAELALNAEQQKKRFEWASSLKKYQEIIISIVLFLIFNLSILLLNYYQSFKVADSANAINIASQQSGLIQDIAKNLTDISLAIANKDEDRIDTQELKKEIFKQFNALSASKKRFGEVLDVLQNGGSLFSLDGEQLKVAAIEIPSARKNLERVREIWMPFQGMIDHFINDYQNNNIQSNVVTFATDYARIYTTRLLLELDDVSTALQVQAESQAKFIQLIQIIGIIIALSIFFFIVFRSLRALLQSDVALAKSRRETTEIMDTITEGLFLIDENYVIGEQQSRKLRDIFPIRNLTGRKLDDVLHDLIGETDIINVRRFIKQLFNRKTRENLIGDLNPLRRLVIKDNNDESERYLRFNFTRSYEGKKIVHALVSISDITESVEMEQRLEKERKQNEAQFDMLMKLLKIEPNILASFMKNAERMSDKINEILQKKGNTLDILEKKNQMIFREVHSFKGEASALQLTGFVDIAEEMENHLKLLSNKPNITGNDFLRITILLEEFFRLTTELNGIRTRLLDMHFSVGNNAQSNANSLEITLKNFAQQIAERNHKKVKITIQGFENVLFSDDVQHRLKEIIIQMLRNAIVHGIEIPQERIAKGKEEIGHIIISLTEKADSYQVTIQDDGAGIDKEAIRARLIEKGICSPIAAENLDEKTLFRAIFLPGFSTQVESTEDAGRGVGMDVVKDRIKSLGGKMQIQSKTGECTRFDFMFPSA
ncbi:ATP-binding protein [Suttonella ornithocola]|uniref:Chemotaxis protein CheA n=1 Tax=Suttonella ornithocola TaxID=279832 RepID=A0A380MUP9_9GAMM|nr:ATP-binding protein [Suttonella ornithocola]SUO95087.1 Chemotaxis protein CheA [Suttonella ornithocola]